MSPLYRHGPNDPPNPHGAPLSRPVLALFGMLAIIGLLAAGFTIAIYLEGRDTRRTDAVSACRSTLNARVVIAKAAVDDVILDGLIVLATDGDLYEVVKRVAPVRARRDAAIDAYERGTELAESNPAAFLGECNGSG